MAKTDDYLEKARMVYPSLNSREKELFNDLFEAKNFITTISEWEAYIIPRVTSFEAACAEIGEDPNHDRFSLGDPDDEAYQKIKTVIKALNGPFLIRNADPDQEKWQPWMVWNAKRFTPGFRLDVSYYGLTGAYAAGGSRLRLCSKKISDHFGTCFEALINQFLN